MCVFSNLREATQFLGQLNTVLVGSWENVDV